MEFILVCSGFLLGGVMSALIFTILGSGWIGFFLFILSVVIIYFVYIYYKNKSKSIPFKDLKKTADIISHINFKEITK